MKQKTKRKLLSFMITLAMDIGLVLGMASTVYAKPACPVCGNYKDKTSPNTFWDFTGIDGTYQCTDPSHGDMG